MHVSGIISVLGLYSVQECMIDSLYSSNVVVIDYIFRVIVIVTVIGHLNSMKLMIF